MQTDTMRLTATATQVAAADTTDQTIKTLTDASEVVRFPILAVFHKAAGTAYSSATGDLRIEDEDGGVWFSLPAAGFLDSALEKARAVPANFNAYTGGNKTIKLSATGTVTADTGSPGITVSISYYTVVLK